jgi:hypothetical protein
VADAAAPDLEPTHELAAGVLASLIDPSTCSMHSADVLRAGCESLPAVCSAMLRARERLPLEGSSRSGEMPEPTVTVRMKENERADRRVGGWRARDRLG